MWGQSNKTTIYEPGSWSLPDRESTSTLILDTQPPEVCEINVCCLSLQSVTLCYNTSNWPRQWIFWMEVRSEPERRWDLLQSGVCGAGRRVVRETQRPMQISWDSREENDHLASKGKLCGGWSAESKGRQQWAWVRKTSEHQALFPFSRTKNW